MQVLISIKHILKSLTCLEGITTVKSQMLQSPLYFPDLVALADGKPAYPNHRDCLLSLRAGRKKLLNSVSADLTYGIM